MAEHDRDRSTAENYLDAGNLKARVDLYRYRSPEADPVDVAMKLLPEGLRLILDVGCGFGRYTTRLRSDRPESTVVGIDAAPGMLTEVPPPVMVADARSLPYPDGGADAVLAMHVLYHVPDIPRAVAEFRRVLRPGGTLLVSTNDADDMAPMWELWSRAIRSVLGDRVGLPQDEIARFDSANAPGYLAEGFESVEVFEERGTVSVPEAEPVIKYLASTRSFVDCDDEAFEAIVDSARRELAAHFESGDRFEFEKAVVFYRCR